MTLALLLRYWKPLLLGAIAAAIGIALKVAADTWTARGRQLQRAEQADSLLRLARPAMARTETLVVHDVKTVTERIDRLRMDTLWRTDTLTLPGDSTPRVAIPVVVLHQTDSALAACTALARDCSAFRDSAKAVIAALNAKVAAQVPEKPPPSRTRWFLAGAAVGRSSCYAAPPHPFP